MEKRREDAFLLRIWTEPGAAGAEPWRAVIQHVASQERRYFTNYGELCEFLERFCRPQRPLP